MTLKGNTADFPLETVLRLLGETKKTGELTLRSEKGAGALGLAEGRVVTSVFGDEAPIPALGSIWDMGSDVDFEFTPWNDPPPANLEGELQDNLRKADEYKKWRESVRQVIPHDRMRFRLSERAAEQGAVTFTSDRWRVVLAVNGQRDVNGLAEHLKVDRDTALTTLAGLVRDGVIETIEPPEETSAPPAPSPPEPRTFAPPPSEPVTRPPSEPLFVPPSEPAPPPAAPAPEPVDWTAALLEKRQQQQGAPSTEHGPEWTPPSPIPETQWTMPESAEGWSPPEPLAPQEPAPTYDTTHDTWTPPAPPVETPQWSPPAAENAPEWTPPVAPQAPQPEAPRGEAAEAPWTPPVEIAPEWTEPTPAPAEPEPPAPAPAFDDRLAALEGLFNSPPVAAPAPTREWTTPTPAPEWTPPQPEAPAGTPPASEDPRLAALTAPPPSPPPVFESKPAPTAPSSEWAPPPPPEPRAPERKKGLFGGLFGGKREEAARGAAMTETAASSQAGLLASFSNALLNEYNSGHYGKGKVDDRIPSLLMRVDEQADPIDKPLPVVDDRLDVQALERVGLPETQAVPYLAMLVTTIYGDAEKAFGKDKARRGYKIALMHVTRGDMSVLSGLAGKLPKI